jgi:transposase
LAHPLYVAKLKGSPDKSDRDDAQLLADLNRVGYLPTVWLPPAPIRELRQLVKHRQRLADDRRALKQRIGGVLRSERVKVTGVNRWTKAWVAAVRDHAGLSATARWLIGDLLDELDSMVRRLDRAVCQLRVMTTGDALVAKLLTLEGIGEVTAWALRASIGTFSRFAKAKQLCRYCGLSPKNTASGQRQTAGHLIQLADRRLRALLVQAAQRLVRVAPRWRVLLSRLVSAGKARNVAVAAVANRWLRTVHTRMVAYEREVGMN